MLRILIVIGLFYIIQYNCQVVRHQHVIDDFMTYNDDLEPYKGRNKRHNYGTTTPFCGATALRLNMSLAKVYGKWYPVQASKMAYELWMTSLYANETGAAIICPIWNLLPGKEIGRTLDIIISHQKKTIRMAAYLLGDEPNSGPSKWVVSWPNGEDTLTSIVAIGGNGTEKDRYEWMLTMDCDLNGTVSSDWAIFSRRADISPKSLEAIRAIVDGIQGLQTLDTKKTGEMCEK